MGQMAAEMSWCPPPRGTAGVLGHLQQRIDVAGLTLVGPHAGGRVALEVLDRAVVLARRKLHVLRRHVVLQVDELLAGTPATRVIASAAPLRPAGAAGAGRAERQRFPDCRGMITRGLARENACAGADAAQARRLPSGTNIAASLQPAQLSTGLRMQVHRGRKPPALRMRSQSKPRCSPSEAPVRHTRNTCSRAPRGCRLTAVRAALLITRQPARDCGSGVDRGGGR